MFDYSISLTCLKTYTAEMLRSKVLHNLHRYQSHAINQVQHPQDQSNNTQTLYCSVAVIYIVPLHQSEMVESNLQQISLELSLK